MKNKSSVYVFPVIYYKMVEEGLDGDIINFIDNTFLYNKDGLFTIKLTNENIYTKKPIGQELIDNIEENVYVLSCTKIDNGYVIHLKTSEALVDLVKHFEDGAYSNISETDKIDILDFNWHFCGLDKYIEIGYILFKNKDYRNIVLAKYGIKPSDMKDDIELDSVINLDDETYATDTEETIEESDTEV